ACRPSCSTPLPYTTLFRSTESTQSGPQHPAYDINLSGTGDLVLTDLRSTSGRLLIAGDIEGRIFIHDEGDKLVVEFAKGADKPRSEEHTSELQSRENLVCR